MVRIVSIKAPLQSDPEVGFTRTNTRNKHTYISSFTDHQNTEVSSHRALAVFHFLLDNSEYWFQWLPKSEFTTRRSFDMLPSQLPLFGAALTLDMTLPSPTNKWVIRHGLPWFLFKALAPKLRGGTKDSARSSWTPGTKFFGSTTGSMA